jgi:signal transduction histidine kinase
MTSTPRHHFSLPLYAGLLAFVVPVVAAYASGLAYADSPLRGPNAHLLYLLGAAYLVIGCLVLPRLDQTSSRWLVLFYFSTQLALSAGILTLSRLTGFMTLVLFPLASNALEALPRRQAVAMWLVLLAVFVAVDGSLFGWLDALHGAPVVAAGIIFVGVFTYFAQSERAARDEAARLAAELGAANQKLREYAAQVEELAIAKERNRLAREIHDSLGHYLTVVNVQLEAAQVMLASDPERASAALHKAQTLAQEGLADVRRSVAAIRASPTGSRPLPEALAELAEESRAAGILTYLEVRGQPRPLTPQAELTLYRAAQEALTNVRKHAHASRADLTLDFDAGQPGAQRVRLVVQDNGVGAAQPNGAAPQPAGTVQPDDGGFGLLGLRERVQLIGGNVQVRSQPGEGFRLEVEVA